MNKTLVKKIIGYVSTVLILMIGGESFLNAINRASEAVVL
jgi:hypothetical protein